MELSLIMDGKVVNLRRNKRELFPVKLRILSNRLFLRFTALMKKFNPVETPEIKQDWGDLLHLYQKRRSE